MNLKHYRLIKGFTQSHLAKLLKIDQSTISKWEQNVSQPNLSILKKLASILDCSVDELLN